MEAKIATWDEASIREAFIMDLHVILQSIRSFETLAAKRIFASKGSFFSMDNDVSFHI